MRVLTIADVLDSVGGRPWTELAVAQGLAARGHEVELLFRLGGDLESSWREVARRCRQVPVLTPRRAALRDVAALVRSAIPGVRLRPDVVLVHRVSDALLGALIARCSGARLVVHAHEVPPNELGRAMRLGLRRTSAIIAVSSATAAAWRRMGVSAGRIAVVHNGVDLEKFRPANATERAGLRAALGIAPDEFVLLFAGRIDREKGVDVLVEAFARLSGGAEGVTLLVAGEPYLDRNRPASDDLTELRRRSRDVPVRWLGRRSDVPDLYRVADVTVVPSRWPDPFPRTVLEALASGCCVIGSDIGGITEALDGSGSWLVPPDDISALTEALERARDDATLSERAAQARRTAEARFGCDAMIDNVERVLEEARGSSRRLTLTARGR